MGAALQDCICPKSAIMKVTFEIRNLAKQFQTDNRANVAEQFQTDNRANLAKQFQTDNRANLAKQFQTDNRAKSVHFV